MPLLRKCIHVSDEYEFGRKEVSLQRFKYVTYDIDGGQEGKKIQSVTSQVRFCDFMKDFVEKTRHYVQHVHVAQWKDDHFRICRDTFPIGIVLSVVDFAEKYTLQPKNEIQSQYYHSE
jgi:hypothetical protein